MRLIFLFILMAYSSVAFSQNDSGKVFVDTVQFGDYSFEIGLEKGVEPQKRAIPNLLITSKGDTIGSLSPGRPIGTNLYDNGILHLRDDTIQILGYQNAVLVNNDSTIILYGGGTRYTAFALYDLRGNLLGSNRVSNMVSGAKALNFNRNEGIYTWGRTCDYCDTSSVRKFSFSGELEWEVPLNVMGFAGLGGISFSPDGKYLTVFSYPKGITNNAQALIIDVEKRKVVLKLDPSSFGAFKPLDQKRFFVTTAIRKGEIRAFNDGSLIMEIQGYSDFVYERTVGFFGDAEMLIWPTFMNDRKHTFEFIDLKTFNVFNYNLPSVNLGRLRSEIIDSRTVQFRSYNPYPSETRITVRLLE